MLDAAWLGKLACTNAKLNGFRLSLTIAMLAASLDPKDKEIVVNQNKTVTPCIIDLKSLDVLSSMPKKVAEPINATIKNIMVAICINYSNHGNLSMLYICIISFTLVRFEAHYNFVHYAYQSVLKLLEYISQTHVTATHHISSHHAFQPSEPINKTIL